jgi:hypothetical protein
MRVAVGVLVIAQWVREALEVEVRQRILLAVLVLQTLVAVAVEQMMGRPALLVAQAALA